MVSNNLTNHLINHITKTNRPKVIYSFRILTLEINVINV